MPMQRIKKDLLTIGILTAVVCCAGILEFMFRSGAATSLILLGLLAAGWVIAFLLKSAKSKPGYGIPSPSAVTTPRPARVERIQTRLSLSNGPVVLFAYVVLLCLAGVVVTGGTMATVVFGAFAIIATLGAVVSAMFSQKTRSRQG
ncbi:hypothetical protein [Arthrobacter globiformis]|uniref:hypothetical protein n=1 Tax=Arthrobacter globiformis TaxID=1665 RepID=UPI00278B6FED|nr:hypothetical protein [Arthrobacter globiformis]MDQ0865283.1 ABC-type bacteriocin/lantibiotic exporter with double-glycine peptidase domain [Arthrobacter globiformis]